MKVTKRMRRLSRDMRKRAVFTASVKGDLATLTAQRGEVFKASLLALADDWAKKAKARNRSLKRAGKYAPDREALESTALAYASCSLALRTLVGRPAPSRTPPRPKDRKTPPA